MIDGPAYGRRSRAVPDGGDARLVESGEPPGYSVRLVQSEEPRDWVVMLPGAGATISVWSAQVRAFAEHFNLALVDLPGHLRKANARGSVRLDGAYTFDGLVTELGSAIDRAGIGRCHVVALSLGTILARAWAARDPCRLQSAVLAGTIADLTLLTRTLMKAGWYLRRLLPYMALYRLYAWVIMPARSHRPTRRLFYRDARALGRAEFNRWFDLSADVSTLLLSLRHGEATVASASAFGRVRRQTRPRRTAPIPMLHVMGSNDRMFLRGCERLAAEEGSSIHVIAGAGHVCSVEAPGAFNDAALRFLRIHAGSSASRLRPS